MNLINDSDSVKTSRMLEGDELAFLSVDQLAVAYADGSVSPVDVVAACLSRIEAYNTQVNAYCYVDTEGAMQSARESEQRWRKNAPLSVIDGVPVSSKDTTRVEGWTSSLGSHVLGMKTPAEDDSSSVLRMKEAGAVFLGLTNSPEIGWKGVTDSPRHGVTRNPWHAGMTSGGSSGGAAVAAALGMGNLHIGTDAGGSIRIPASFTGVFGFKPSFGRVPNYPPSAFSTLAHAGPITRSVRDAMHMLTVISGHDSRDWYALPSEDVDYAELPPTSMVGLKIAYCPSIDGMHVECEVADLVSEAVDIFRQLGAEVEEQELDVHGAEDIFEAYWDAAVTWRLRNLSKADLEMLDPGLLSVYRKAKNSSLIDYMEAGQRRIALGARANLFHEKYPILLMPTLPIAAFPVGQNVPDTDTYADWSDWARFCYLFNLTRQPAASVPCGFTPEGLPVGLQIIARQFDDMTVLGAATAFESVRPFEMPGAANKIVPARVSAVVSKAS